MSIAKFKKSGNQEGGIPLPQTGQFTRLAIVLLLLLEGLPRLYFALSGMVPAGHDGWQRFYLQEFFFSGIVTTGEMPAWLPYLSQGTVASWWAAISGSAGLSLFALIGSVCSRISFVSLFWAADGLDRVLFAIGLALYVQYFVRNEIAAWTAALLATATISDVIQPWHNLRSYFLLPLVFLFLHLSLSKRNSSLAAIAGMFFVWQVYCGLPYFAILLSFLIFLYFSSILILQPRESISNIFDIIQKPARLVASFVVCLLVVGAYYCILQAGTEQIRNFNPGRSSDGTVTLDTFLNYAKIPSFTNWLELFTGISPCIDYTLFIGAGGVGLIVAGLASGLKDSRDSQIPLFFVVVAYLFSIGSFVATLSYYLWPGMSLVRHISLIAPLLKIPLFVFLGFGVSNLLSGSRRISSRASLICMGFLMIGAGLSYWSGMIPAGIQFWSGIMGDNKVQPHPVLSASYISKAGIITMAWSISFLVLLMLGTFIFRDSKHRQICFSVFLALNLIAGYFYRLDRDFAGLTTLTSLPGGQMPGKQLVFQNRRHLNLLDGNERLKFATAQNLFWDGRFRYWSENLFWRQEEVTSTFRIDHWLESYDGVLRVFDSDSFDSPSPPSGFRPYWGMVAPVDPLFYSISGVTQDKARLFDHAVWYDRESIGRKMRLYGPDDTDLLLLKVDTSPLPDFVLGEKSRPPAETQQVTCTRFSANRVDFETSVLNPDGAWLFFSNAWHPSWSATVNGLPVKNERGFYGYQAVHLPAGISSVEFRFELPLYQEGHFLFRVIGALLALATIGVCFLGPFYADVWWNGYKRYLES
jgi:hypothetical protein